MISPKSNYLDKGTYFREWFLCISLLAITVGVIYIKTDNNKSYYWIINYHKLFLSKYGV